MQQQNFRFNLPESPIQTITHPILLTHQVSLQIKRDDLLHPIIAGNKWRKLKYNLIAANSNKIEHLITFGGAFSNHLHAFSCAARIFGFKGTAIVRGPELDLANPTLRFAAACGVNLIPVSRLEYRERNNAAYLAELQSKHPNAYIIPEGGTNELALKGVHELAASLPSVDHVITATGSAGTLTGLIEGVDNNTQVHGIAVLKQAGYLHDVVKALSAQASRQNNWHLHCDYHFSGYGKFTPEVWQFCQQMKPQLPLEPIYTGKMLLATLKLVELGYFAAGSKIMAIHTGGLQGLDGLKYRGLIG